MNNKLNPRKLSREDVWKYAEEFRATYVRPVDRVPVLIDEIIETKLRLTIIPTEGLAGITDIEGFLSNNLKYIYIDNNRFSQDKFANRVRFTLAHEVGHYILHPEQIKQLTLGSIDDWIEFNIRMKDDPNLEWFEWQAKEFAGRLLVPKDILISTIEEQREKIDLARASLPDTNGDQILLYLSNMICKKFGVSPQVIMNRVYSEKIRF
jgi:Zn-dependent peptidase ImmA (M78 family)